MAEKLSFKGALLKLRKAPNDATAQARVTDEIQDRALLALDGEGNIDVAETDEGVAFASRPGRRLNSMEGRVSLSDWLSRQVPQDEACPISGRLLYKGVTTQGRPKVNWSAVPMSRRFAVAMARLNREPAAQIGQEELAASALEQEAPPVPYSRFLEEWAELAKAVEGGRPSAAQRNLHQAAKDACYHEEAPAAAGSSFPVETVSGATGGNAHQGGYDRPLPTTQGNPCAGATGACRTPDCRFPSCLADGDQTTTPASASATIPVQGAASRKLIYIVAHAEEREMVKQLRRHLYTAERFGKIEMADSFTCPPGANWRQVREDYLRRASMVVYMVSAALLADPEFAYTDMVQNARSATHVPVLARSAFAYKMVFGGAVSLPRNGATVSESSDRDRTLSEIAVELQRALGIG